MRDDGDRTRACRAGAFCSSATLRLKNCQRDETVNQLAEKLATKLRINKTEAVRFALNEALDALERAKPLRERLAPLRQRILARPATGLDADKTFFDDLNGAK